MEWFQNWFDTKYYHLLYEDRNDEEAQFFMKNLTSFLGLDKTHTILDLPCGKGRHSIFLNSLGYRVIGADLSKNSIAYAKQFENDSLTFEVHDMRTPFNTKFDAIFNLFTSFGYFDDATNIATLKNLKNGLHKNGMLVIDFMNVHLVSANLVPSETIIKDNITFKIDRSIDADYIKKDIRFTTDNNEYHFTEKVRFLTLNTLQKYTADAGMELKHIFGDYNLNPFDIDTSSRLILILE